MQDEWIAGGMNAADFPRPAAGTLGTLPRNAYYGPGYSSTDLSLFKNFRIPAGGSEKTVQFRIEAYNIFDQLNLNNPNANVANTNFGRVTAVRAPAGLPGARLIQIGAKFLF